MSKPEKLLKLILTPTPALPDAYVEIIKEGSDARLTRLMELKVKKKEKEKEKLKLTIDLIWCFLSVFCLSGLFVWLLVGVFTGCAKRRTKCGSRSIPSSQGHQEDQKPRVNLLLLQTISDPQQTTKPFSSFHHHLFHLLISLKNTTTLEIERILVFVLILILLSLQMIKRKRGRQRAFPSLFLHQSIQKKKKVQGQDRP